VLGAWAFFAPERPEDPHEDAGRTGDGSP
jgi:hypothetical protein